MNGKEFNRVLETYLVEGYMYPEDYEAMDEMQKHVIQCIKRARKRLKAKEN